MHQDFRKILKGANDAINPPKTEWQKFKAGTVKFTCGIAVGILGTLYFQSKLIPTPESITAPAADLDTNRLNNLLNEFQDNMNSANCKVSYVNVARSSSEFVELSRTDNASELSAEKRKSNIIELFHLISLTLPKGQEMRFDFSDESGKHIYSVIVRQGELAPRIEYPNDEQAAVNPIGKPVAVAAVGFSTAREITF